MIKTIKKFYPDFNYAEEAPICYDGVEVGWHVTLFNKSNRPLGSGCSHDRNIARRIAVAEAIERAMFVILSKQSPTAFLLEELPSTSGFAVGFDKATVQKRAVAEAVERWAWSQWIDSNCPIEFYIPETNELSPLANYFRSQFDSLTYFKKKFEIEVDSQTIPLQFGVTIGFKEGGAFPGSRVCSLNESPWEHGLVEAWRHNLLSREKGQASLDENIYKERVHYFGHNEAQAKIAIDPSRKKTTWPKPSLRLLEQVEIMPSGTFMWRALCKNFVPWHLGSNRRFVY